MIEEAKFNATFTMLSDLDQNRETLAEECMEDRSNDEPSQFIMDLKAELKHKTTSEIRIILLEEFFGQHWHNFMSEGLAQSLENFTIERVNTIEGDDDDRVSKDLSSFVRDPQITLMERNSHQRLTNHEKLYIFKRYAKEGVSVKDLWAEYWVSSATVSKVIKDFSNNKIKWNCNK